jgi:L-ornithine Nalpha-acyltransferase
LVIFADVIGAALAAGLVMGKIGRESGLSREKRAMGQAYQVRAAQSAADFAAVMALRRARFGVGEDSFDGACTQVMIEQGGALLGAYRLGYFANGAAVAGSYSAQFYNLAGLAGYARPALELGRFCIAHGVAEADVLRLAFAGLARRVDSVGAGLLFGCASFAGSDPAPHLPSLAALRRHCAPAGWVGRKSAHIIDFSTLSCGAGDGARGIPPLLRSYLAIGGWVSDHAVQDFDLGTIHVFTGVEVDLIPPARARALRLLGAQIDDSLGA